MYNVANDARMFFVAVNNVYSFSAPQKVLGQMRNARPSPPTADLQQGSESHGVMRDGPVPSGNLESSPSLSPEATR